MKNLLAASRKESIRGVEKGTASPDKDVTSSKPSASVSKSPHVFVPKVPLLRKRLIGGPNDPGTISKEKRKASGELREVRRSKMARHLERIPKVVPHQHHHQSHTSE
ncbi:hypothetical protein ACOSQ4_023663 [Xanthoceras sorbifolium]